MSDPTLAFAVDFDGTFTKAPETFRAIISSLKIVIPVSLFVGLILCF